MENKVRMIITDLDNSLLNNKREISEYTKKIFQKCKDSGIIIVFATARPYRSTEILFSSIKPDALICHCGGVIYINDQILCQNGIDPVISYKIISNISKDYENINIGIECDNEFYANFNAKMYWENVDYRNMDVNKLPSGIIYKIVVGLEQFKSANLIEKYIPKELYTEKLDNKVWLIMNKNATKWNGIKTLLQYYGYKIENTISFGDDDVDAEMIEKSGMGIAMENGNERIKNKAKYICGNNNEDGIAKWIEENVL
jgi:Cof subfamily protein (haloacid dehalogenase superfamily)